MLHQVLKLRLTTTQQDQTFVGSRIPEVTGGLGTRLKFKGLSVDANFTYAGGHKIYEQWAGYYMHSGLLSVMYYQGDLIL